MKLIVIHITGLASEPFEELDGQTLVESAPTEALDEIARRGSCGTVRLLPDDIIGGAGAELLALLGYVGERAKPPSLGVLEAAGIGVPLYQRDVAFRVNLSSLSEDGIILDTSGAGIPLEEALALMERIDEKLATRWLRFYPGRYYAHVMVRTDGPTDVHCVPAPLIVGQALDDVLPEGDGERELRQLIWDSVELLNDHRINYIRREEGLLPVNLLWPWAPGRPLDLQHFVLRTGQKAQVLARRLEVLGAARCVSIPTRESPRSLSAARQLLLEIARENALAYLHLDLSEHFDPSPEPEAWIETFTELDTQVVSAVLKEVRTSPEAVRFLLLGTWPETGWTARPPALWGTFPALRVGAGIDVFTEAALVAEGLAFAEPTELMREAIGGIE
ncbi:MAG: hypothetical protein ACUVX8_14425 [Candidatus Zipacnadales bacterium]